MPQQLQKLPNNTMKKFLRQFGVYGSALVIAFALFMGISIVRGFVPPPTNNPPSGNVPPPINVGAGLQAKGGEIGADDFLLNSPSLSVREGLTQAKHYHLEIS